MASQFGCRHERSHGWLAWIALDMQSQTRESEMQAREDSRTRALIAIYEAELRIRKDVTTGGVTSLLSVALLLIGFVARSHWVALAAAVPGFIAFYFWKDHFERMIELPVEVKAHQAALNKQASAPVETDRIANNL